MKKTAIITISTILMAGGAGSVLAADGQQLFASHCAMCHPDGGNIVNPTRTLHRKTLEQHGIKGWQGIVKTMRHPGAGMTTFDKQSISDKDAKVLAEYVLKTFK